jgi:phosphoglycerol transferase MdoB-like AlkP superfamily enzyme
MGYPACSFQILRGLLPSLPLFFLFLLLLLLLLFLLFLLLLFYSSSREQMFLSQDGREPH